MKSILLLAVAAFFWQDLPYKPKEEFDIKLDYQLKQRTFSGSGTLVHLDESRKEYERRTSTDLLPFLALEIKLLKLAPGEVKVKIVNNRKERVLNRKVEQGDVVPLLLGFTDDVKDRVKAHEYTLFFMNKDKEETSRIVVTIDEDGTFNVNGEKRGQF